MNYKIILTDSIKISIRELKKKYKNVKEDVRKALAIIETNPFLGVSIKGYGKLWKFRVKNSDIRKGKRSGYRLIYYINSNQNLIIPLLIYEKTEKENVTQKELKKLLTIIEKI